MVSRPDSVIRHLKNKHKDQAHLYTKRTARDALLDSIPEEAQTAEEHTTQGDSETPTHDSKRRRSADGVEHSKVDAIKESMTPRNPESMAHQNQGEIKAASSSLEGTDSDK